MTIHAAFVKSGASGGMKSRDGYIRCQGSNWVIGTDFVERSFVLENGRLSATSFRNKRSGRELLPGGKPVDEGNGFEPALDAGQGFWNLRGTDIHRGSCGELQLDIQLTKSQVMLTRTYVVYPGSSVIRYWAKYENQGQQSLRIIDPPMLALAVQAADSPDSIDFHWMVGAHCEPGCWTLRTEKLTAEKTRRFDSYDPFPPRGKPSPNDQKMGSESYAPWYAVFDRQSRDGLILGWDYMGHWKTSFVIDKSGWLRTDIRVAGHKQQIPPGGSMVTPMALTALFKEDLDNAGNELLDWQYEYLWEYTREGWFPAIPMLGCWFKGTGWGEANVPWWGSGKTDIPSQFTKIFRMADLIRQVGGDIYHRDWGWWDRAGDWNGPDFGSSGRYLSKSGIGQIIYAFIYTVDPESKLAKAHPDWIIGQTLDMSKPEVVRHLQWQLDDFHSRWGDFAWRNDSTPTSPRDGDDTPLLAQDQNFRAIIKNFLDKYPKSSFQSVNGGGNEAGYDYLRLSGMFQFSDGVIGPLRNYHASLLFPPDKLMDNGDQWDPNQYEKARWRGLLSMAIMVTGDTRDKQKLEGMREVFDIYHYLAAEGVVGRWVKVYRPKVTGDDPTLYLQRLSRDRLRGIIVPGRAPAANITLWPKGLIPDADYRVSFQESLAESVRSGADLMAQGITLSQAAPGELIYLNLPFHPGNRLDHQPPRPPAGVKQKAGTNMGYRGVELTWKPARDNHWVSYYEVLRDDQIIDKVAKGTFYFDHSAGNDPAARYQVRTVDGAGNASLVSTASGMMGKRGSVIDDADPAAQYSGWWQHEQGLQPPHMGTISWSDKKGAAVEMSFSGKQISWFTKLGPNCGQALVIIDGGPARTVDTYCSDDVWGVCVFEQSLTNAGPHRLRIEVSGSHADRATGNCVHLDGIRAE